MTTLKTLALTALIGLTTAACDVHLVPETGAEAGSQSTRLAVNIGSVSTESLGDEVEEIRVNVVDVLVHKVDDGSWVILNAEEIEVDLIAETQRSIKKELPIVLGSYDRVLLVLDGAQVMVDERWEPATVTASEIEIDADLWVAHGSELQIDFDLFGAVLRSPVNGWTFTPNPSAYTR